ncbi:Hypothetical_protein [Hexamita inflata]|uniref:Hypothetical_protein n=1 Tax=Hexamita inflata TaxID=28002 RepID=A0AA86Q180_9EUKA|nr:Hypothetical protein HINF_LOCUS31179 [Hexamita inflata]
MSIVLGISCGLMAAMTLSSAIAGTLAYQVSPSDSIDCDSYCQQVLKTGYAPFQIQLSQSNFIDFDLSKLSFKDGAKLTRFLMNSSSSDVQCVQTTSSISGEVGKQLQMYFTEIKQNQNYTISNAADIAVNSTACPGPCTFTPPAQISFTFTSNSASFQFCKTTPVQHKAYDTLVLQSNEPTIEIDLNLFSVYSPKWANNLMISGFTFGSLALLISCCCSNQYRKDSKNHRRDGCERCVQEFRSVCE